MAKKFGSAIDLQKIPVVGLVPESGATAPASPTAGQLWLDTSVTPNRLKVYENGVWVLVSQDGSLLTTTSFSGDVSGTYSNLQLGSGVVTTTEIADGTITLTDINASASNAAAATPSLRSLGTTSTTAMAGDTRLDTITAPTGAVSLNGQKITNLGTPTASTDAATKGYVDGVSQGLDVKNSVRLASTATVTVTYNATGGTSGRGQITAAPNTLDGVNLAANDRILLKNQSTAAQNGIWVVSTLGAGSNGVWDRATDFDTDAEVTAGAFVFVEEGTANSDTGWVLTTNNPITIGGASGTSLAFTQFSSAGAYIAGAGLTLTGSTFDVGGTANRITVTADNVDIASTYVGQTSITTLGTVGTGTWQGTAVGVLYGGTGATDATTARANLGATGKYAATLGALTAGTPLTITHSLNSSDVVASFRDVSTGAAIDFAWTVTGVNTITVTADLAYTASTVRVVVVG